MRKKGLLLMAILAAVSLTACSKNTSTDATTTPAPTNAAGTENKEGSETPTDAVTATPTPTEAPTPTPTEVPLPSEPVIVDGLDITKSVSGIPLKDAYKDYFKIGVGINGTSPSNATVASAAMSEVVKYHFNSATCTNLMKPSYFLNQQGSIANYKAGNPEPALRFDSAKSSMDFCKENNIQMRGHTLVWHAQTPDWFFREGYQSNGAYVDKETMLARMESYIKQTLEYFQTNYPGVIYCWDVVNEAVEIADGMFEKESGFNIRTKSGEGDNPWYITVGVDYVEKAFEYARKYADKDVKLFYNDYNTFYPAKTNKICAVAKHLKSKGLIDGIGMQSYMDLTTPGFYSGNLSFLTALTKFAELGLEIQLTELTINSPDNSPENMEKQAERYRSLFELLKSMDTASGKSANITSVTVFGVMDEYLFYPSNPEPYARLFDGKLQPKPAFYSILEVGTKK